MSNYDVKDYSKEIEYLSSIPPIVSQKDANEDKNKHVHRH